jgi:hypothetical protein
MVVIPFFQLLQVVAVVAVAEIYLSLAIRVQMVVQVAEERVVKLLHLVQQIKVIIVGLAQLLVVVAVVVQVQLVEVEMLIPIAVTVETV